LSEENLFCTPTTKRPNVASVFFLTKKPFVSKHLEEAQ
jgi:hypothetical protein